jgi:hypothetical protein
MPLTLSDGELSALSAHFERVATTLETMQRMIDERLAEVTDADLVTLRESVLKLRLDTAELTRRLHLPIHRAN